MGGEVATNIRKAAMDLVMECHWLPLLPACLLFVNVSESLPLWDMGLCLDCPQIFWSQKGKEREKAKGRRRHWVWVVKDWGKQQYIKPSLWNDVKFPSRVLYIISLNKAKIIKTDKSVMWKFHSFPEVFSQLLFF